MLERDINMARRVAFGAAALTPGTHAAVWNGRDATGHAMASGSYLARLVAGGKVEWVRLSLVR
jgi:hypothetical protein